MINYIDQTVLFIFDFFSSLPKNRRIIFISREGIFLKKIYDEFCIKKGIINKSMHFCISRSVIADGLIDIPGGIEIISNQPSAENDCLKIISSRLNVNYDLILKLRSESNNDSDFFSKIFFHLRSNRKSPTRKYIESFGFKKYDVIVDIGYRGFIQYGIELIMNIKLEGRYIYFRRNEFPISGKGFLQGKNAKLFFKARLFYEALMNGNALSLAKVVDDDFLEFRCTYKNSFEKIPFNILKIRDEIIKRSKNIDINISPNWSKYIFDIENIFNFGKDEIIIEDDFGGSKQRKLMYV